MVVTEEIVKLSSHSTSAVSKKFCIVIQGIEECKDGTEKYARHREDLRKVVSFLSSVDDSIRPESIRDHRRLGSYYCNRKRPRPILVDFLRSADVASILSKRSTVQPPYSIQDYMSSEELSRNAVLLKKRWSIHTETGIDLKQIKIRKCSIYVHGELHGTLNLTTSEYEPYSPPPN